MLELTIPEREATRTDANGEVQFYILPATKLQLEHSLLSISKWETKWGIAFLGPTQKTNEQILDYIRCMSIGKEPSETDLSRLSQKNVDDITEYINSKKTATYLPEQPAKKFGAKEVVTSELIYYWMIALNIPFECQKWHLDRLFTLIQVCNVKNNPGKKMSRKDIYAQNKQLNAARRAKMNSSG